jgi:hypothetical protein
MLKTYTIKLLDVYRREVFQQIKTNPKKGMKNLVRMAFILMLMNMSSDEIKDFLLGRETTLSDQVMDNIIKLFGFSKYNIYKAREGGIGSAISGMITEPPITAIPNDVSKDIAGLLEGTKEPKDLQTLNGVPLIGKFYYWWFGAGKEKTEKKKKENSKQSII